VKRPFQGEAGTSPDELGGARMSYAEDPNGNRRFH